MVGVDLPTGNEVRSGKFIFRHTVGVQRSAKKKIFQT
jgi:hypothetical protein